jgi:hypothetical protein
MSDKKEAKKPTLQAQYVGKVSYRQQTSKDKYRGDIAVDGFNGGLYSDEPRPDLAGMEFEVILKPIVKQ